MTDNHSLYSIHIASTKKSDTKTVNDKV